MRYLSNPRSHLSSLHSLHPSLTHYNFLFCTSCHSSLFLSQKHVKGRHCDSCRPGYHTLEHRNSLGCLPCACDISGTVPEGACDMWTGQCPCREGVEGAQCTNCAHNYYNRSLDLQSKQAQSKSLKLCPRLVTRFYLSPTLSPKLKLLRNFHKYHNLYR